MKPSLQASLDFLNKLAPEGPWCLTGIHVSRLELPTVRFEIQEDGSVQGDQRRQDKKSGEVTIANHWELNTFIETLGKNHNMHFTANPVYPTVVRKPSKEHVKALAFLHVDVDPRDDEDLEEEQRRILALLREPPGGIPKPTAIIMSGAGYQALWKLDQQLEVEGNEKRIDDAARYNLALIAAFGGDPGTQNLERLLRLPGTINRPNDRKIKKGRVPVLAELVEWHDDRVYSLDQFQQAPEVQTDQAFSGNSRKHNQTSAKVDTGNITRINDVDDDLPEGVSEQCKVAIVQGKDEDRPLKVENASRSEWLFFVCCELLRNAVDDDTIYAIITDPDFAISDSVYTDSQGKKRSAKAIERYALRQIERAKERAIQPELQELNDRYALIESIGGKCRVICETVDPVTRMPYIDIQDPLGFARSKNNRKVMVTVGQDKNGNDIIKDIPLGKWWLEHPLRRTYATMVFAPEIDVGDSLNLWRGYGVEGQPGNWEKFKTHMRENICRDSTEHYTYLYNWMANVVQQPGKPGQTAIMFRGKQGTGKSFFAKVFGELFGAHFKHVSNSDHLVGRFNTTLHDAVLVFADEAFYAGSKKQENSLKALITEERVMIERKGIDVQQASNCVHLIMASNEDWVVRAAFDDRRIFALEVGDDHANDAAYFGDIIREMEDGGYEAMLYELMHADISDWNVRDVPKTDELRNQQMQTLSPKEDWWLAKLRDGRLFATVEGWPREVLQDQLRDDYLTELRAEGRNEHGRNIAMNMFLTKVLPVEKLRKSTWSGNHEWMDCHGRERTSVDPIMIVMPTLEACRDYWDSIYAPVEWDEVESSDVPDDLPI